MDTDAVIRDIAERQHGVIARQQLLDAGLPGHAVDNRVRNQRLRHLHRGVYGLGPLAKPNQGEMAAVLVCGDGAFLSHRSAGALWGLVPPRDLGRVVARGERQELLDAAQLRTLVNRHPSRPGTPALKAVLSRSGGAALTRSPPEFAFLELVRRARLPVPRANARLRGFEVDFLWTVEHVVVEIDGFTFHSSPRMFELDRRRDRTLAAAGFTVMRITPKQLADEPEAILAQVARALIRGGSGEAAPIQAARARVAPG